MSNTLTNLLPTIYESLDVVSRELIGFINHVARNSSAERAALNETILVPVVQAQAAADNTPGVTAPNSGDQTVGNASMPITKSKFVPIRWDGEDTRGMQNAGTYHQVLKNQFVQGFRTLSNLVEADCAATAIGASRAYGTPGTTPFGVSGDLSDAAQTRLILDNNGCPQGDLHLVMANAAMANIRGKQTVLFKVNESGTDELLRHGVIGQLEGFNLGASGQIGPITKGTGASYTTDTAGYAVGATTINLITGTGTVLAGDRVTFAGDTNIYIVATGVSAPGAITLANPGLRVAIPTSATAITIGATATPNVAFDRNAIQLVTRAPAMPMGGDAADDSILVTDPTSGLTFEVALYRQFLQQVYHVRLAWGVTAIKSSHIALLLS